MATTTNYGWDTPDDTDLVKDGAAAIRTLGSSVDTTTKALNPSTTLGDVEYRSATANTNTRLAIGTTGQVLTVTGGVPAWETISAGGMTLLSTTTLSGVSTTISSIPQTYVNLFIVVSGMTGNTANSRFQLIPNNTANTTDWSVTSTSGAPDSATNTNIVFDNFQNTLRTGGNNISAITFYNYTTTTQNKQFNANGFLVNGASVNSAYNFNGSFKSASALTSLVFNFGGTNTFAGGTVLVYGVK